MRKRKKRLVFEDVEVTAAGAKGKAIGKAPDGRVLFISNAVPGDVATVQTTKRRKAYYEATAIAFKKLSDKRTTPKCQHFGVCGGCKWQHMSYEHQLHYKQEEVVNNLSRIGKVALPPISPIIGSAKEYFYRNKMEFSFSNSRWLTEEEIASDTNIEDRNALGFHIPGMWDKVLDIKQCYLQQEPSNAIRLAVKSFAVKNQMPFFNPRKQDGLLRTLMIRTTSIGEVMVLVQFFREDPENRRKLLDHILESFPDITSLLYVVNSKANDTLYDQEIICYAGRDHIFEQMRDLRFKITAKSFYQTNSEQAYRLYQVVEEFANLKGDELVYDLYTGTGTIAQFIAAKAKNVIGIETVPEAITAAKSNAALNKIENAEFYTGDLKDFLTDSFIEEKGKPQLIITDPPREGMHKNVVEQILKAAPERIVYVSCNSATQARDIALMDSDYEVIRVQPVDMFPQTHHVENVVLLEKRQKQG
ncbi:23S rRNA (uracil(1939)-C(5))-methyltransferase RlmD [Lentiprolixibacter aurantiacus]|uniref:23S rRNA (Uracil(1939)-C(5))-methyltransferase RlmD n=1 Tax=Lentiprolixibacter aurantiacus TaxID=2993939 RepID=A0AAE3MM13_9FLAO|nr:23S rRNA (uracil(1939)-C(5))-methyltransferase RlmD [Lentiprolixibacter aurantiacus]MCX2719349.1 23S rRNA (uracil(1939)-C(5))-methyltransferase RlmD [Lentiprolixibacter aurantiacus]